MRLLLLLLRGDWFTKLRIICAVVSRIFSLNGTNCDSLTFGKGRRLCFIEKLTFRFEKPPTCPHCTVLLAFTMLCLCFCLWWLLLASLFFPLYFLLLEVLISKELVRGSLFFCIRMSFLLWAACLPGKRCHSSTLLLHERDDWRMKC